MEKIKISCVFENVESAKVFILASKGSTTVIYVVYKVKGQENVFSVQNGASSRIGYLEDLVINDRIVNPELVFDSDWRIAYVNKNINQAKNKFKISLAQIKFMNLTDAQNKLIECKMKNVENSIEDFLKEVNNIANAESFECMGG